MGTERPLSFLQARAQILQGVATLAPERVPLAEGAGRVLAEDLRADEPQPRFDYSAMDGYAVCAADLAANGPWRLPVMKGESRAGASPEPLERGAACRIFTGAPVPVGADTVVMQENVERRGEEISLETRPSPGQHIRLAGEDLAIGQIALERATRLSAGAVALAAMLDRSELVVTRRPRVTILCTGEELRAPGSARGGAMIPESNAVALQALARRAAAEVRVAPLAGDDPEETFLAVQSALEGADVVLTVGGVSVGDHDVVRPALERASVTLDFWRVAVKPGKPLAVGRRGQAYVLGLPGNPASALVTFVLFGMPLLRALQGDARPLATPLRASLAKGRKRQADRLELVRATLRREGDSTLATPHDNQASGAVTSLALSDGLAFIEPGQGLIEAGTPVDFLRWDDA
jgi:molybdopterin molybdotransferase